MALVDEALIDLHADDHQHDHHHPPPFGEEPGSPHVAPSLPPSSDAAAVAPSIDVAEPENTWELDPEPPAYVAAADDNNTWQFVPCDTDVFIDIHDLMAARSIVMPSLSAAAAPAVAVVHDDDVSFVPTPTPVIAPAAVATVAPIVSSPATPPVAEPVAVVPVVEVTAHEVETKEGKLDNGVIGRAPAVSLTNLVDPGEGAQPRARASAIWTGHVDDAAKPGLSLLATMSALAAAGKQHESKRGSNIMPSSASSDSSSRSSLIGVSSSVLLSSLASSPASSAPSSPRTPFDDAINNAFAPYPKHNNGIAAAAATPFIADPPSPVSKQQQQIGEDDPFLFVPRAVVASPAAAAAVVEEKEGEGEHGSMVEGQYRDIPGSPNSINSNSINSTIAPTFSLPPSPMAIDLALEHKLSGLSGNGHHASGMDSVGSSPGTSPGGAVGAGAILMKESKRGWGSGNGHHDGKRGSDSSASPSPLLTPTQSPSTRAKTDEQAAIANARGVKAAEIDESKRAAELLMFNTALLRRGGEFLKYGRQGKPHLCQVKCSHDLTKVQWGDKSAASSKIMDVIQGRNTKVFARHNSSLNVLAVTASFSLIWPDRTLDLEVNKKKGADTDCEEWVGAFRWLMGYTAAPQALPSDWKLFSWTVKDVYAHFQGTEVNLLLQKGRQFVKLFVLGRQGKLGSVPRWMFLFNDLIVFTTLPEKDKLQIKTVIPLKSSRVSDRTARIKPTSPLALCLVTPTLTHVLICGTLDVKADLVACFTATLRAQLVHESKNPTPPAPSLGGLSPPPLHPGAAAASAAVIASAAANGIKRPSAVHVRGTPSRGSSHRGSAMDIRSAPDLMQPKHVPGALGVNERPHASIIAANGNDEGIVDEIVSEHSLHLGTLWSACYVPDDALAFDLISDPSTNLNQRDYQGSTPLHIASFRGNTKIMEMLLRAIGAEGRSKRCDVDGLNLTGQSSLWLIAVAGTVKLPDILRLLTRYGADPNQINHTTKQNLLEACSEHKRLESIRILHENGASFHPRYTKSINRMSALHYAAQLNHLPTVTQLVQLGAPVNARDSKLNTPLHLTNSLEIAAYLVGHGARPSLLNDASVHAGHNWAGQASVKAGEASYLGGKEMPGDDDVPDEKQWRSLTKPTDKCDYCVAPVATPLYCRRCGAGTCGACSTKIFRSKNVSGALRCCDACYNTLRYKMEWWDSSAGAEVLGGGTAMTREAMLEGIMDSIFD